MSMKRQKKDHRTSPRKTRTMLKQKLVILYHALVEAERRADKRNISALVEILPEIVTRQFVHQIWRRHERAWNKDSLRNKTRHGYKNYRNLQDRFLRWLAKNDQKLVSKIEIISHNFYKFSETSESDFVLILLGKITVTKNDNCFKVVPHSCTTPRNMI